MIGTAIARLETVPVREVLPHEERDFTPWLEANLDVPAELLERPLELVGREVRVGGFEADLQLRVVGEETQVLVENQYGASDHDHLGKLVTYGAGLGATLFVWLAETVREEHRAALAWLNEATPEEVGFFGVELDFVRVGASPAAPRLRVVAQPNGWQKRVREAVRGGEARPWTEEELARKAFWDAVLPLVRAGLADGEAWRITPRPRNGFAWLTPPAEKRFWFVAYGTVRQRFGVFCRFQGDGLLLFESLRPRADGLGYRARVDEGKGTCTITRETPGDWRELGARGTAAVWFRDELCALSGLVPDGGPAVDSPASRE